MADAGDLMTRKLQQIPLDMPFPKLQGQDDFIIGACNRLAAAWINRWPNWPKPGHSLNLVGPVGTGKSHLAAIWQEMCGARLCDHPAELASIMAGGGVPFVVLDKIDGALDWPEDTLFHLFNRCDVESGGLLILSEQPVARMHWDLADLRSRMRGVVMASIELPDDALVYALLEKYFADRQLLAPTSMLRYLVSRMERSFGAVQTIAVAIDQRSIADKKPLSVGLARLVLNELRAPPD